MRIVLLYIHFCPIFIIPSTKERRCILIITVAGVQTPVDTSAWPPLAVQIYEQKKNSPHTYPYQSIQHLQFEMLLRAATVEAANALSQSGLRFATFTKARCNEYYWNLTANGGFRIRNDRTPAEGIRDIFRNGRYYATECATAVVIALYKAMLDTISEAVFNRIYYNLLLYDWHPDPHLPLITQPGAAGGSYMGDLLYFSNPDFFPDTPEWRGENVIKMNENLYYGHPYGIAPAQRFIDGLNRNRIPGSFQSAYLTDEITNPNYLYLSQFATDIRSMILGKIGTKSFVVPLIRT